MFNTYLLLLFPLTTAIFLTLTDPSQMGFFWSGKQISLCSVLFPSVCETWYRPADHSKFILCSPLCSLTGFRHSPFKDPSYFQSWLSWTLSEINKVPAIFTPFYSTSLLLCLWSHRPSFPSELTSLNIFFWFVCDTQPAVGLSSREPKDILLEQHPVFVKLLCRETAVKEGCLAYVCGSEILT